ncbi:hypothetical protein [Corynebacterium capitovis]|uniref:hypothetical protein n=1 Tax=Corynebacterium capitovis TaxID=131081 RepID=UPI0003810452|nr:hypothetical protein [Corynebacterium capitovis]
MYTRAQVYSPLQNTAVWLAAWLYGAESTDEVLDALTDLGGDHSFAGEGVAHLLRDVRRAADLTAPGALRLILAGPGQAAALPAGSDAAAALTSAGCIAIRGTDALNHILVPAYATDGVTWRWFVEEERLPEPSWLSPGEADRLLARATEEAALLIESGGGVSTRVPNARLTVGTLADFYDTPGLPLDVSPRAAKLFARADRVAAIVETVADTLGDHTYDPQLNGLWSYIRTARMVGVTEAVLSYWRARQER